MKTNSPYSAAITGGGFLFNETNLLLPLLMSEDSEALLKKEKLYKTISKPQILQFSGALDEQKATKGLLLQQVLITKRQNNILRSLTKKLHSLMDKSLLDI